MSTITDNSGLVILLEKPSLKLYSQAFFHSWQYRELKSSKRMFLGCAPYSLLIQIHNIACQRNQACVKVPVSGLKGVCGSFTQHKLRFNSAESIPWDKGGGGGGGVGGGWKGAVSKKNVFGSSGLGPRFGLKIRGEAGPPGPSPRSTSVQILK